MAYAAFQRRAVDPRLAARTKIIPFPAPVAGWVSAQNLAAAVPGTAIVLENMFPTETGVEIRAGSRKHATVGTQPVESLLSYLSGGVSKLFATMDGSIFDVTSLGDEDTPPDADVTGLASSYFSSVNITTPGGSFLLAANGDDDVRKYDGSAWDTSSWVDSGGTDHSDTIAALWLYHHRVYGIREGTMTAYALPVDGISSSMGDPVTAIELGTVFHKGGSLLFGINWTIDAGDGLDDKCVFVTTEGEVAVYEGSDPSDPSDWTFVGRYEIPRPLGKNAATTVGGDVDILTEQGMIPLSAAINRDLSQVSLVAVSRPIGPDWVSDARQRRSLPWEICKWPLGGKAFVSVPVTGETDVTPPWCYVVNTTSGAWAKYTGWNTRCLAQFGNSVYFGTNDGTVMQAEIGGDDDGAIYVSRCAYAFDHFKAPGVYKTLIEMRGVFVTKSPFEAQFSASSDFALAWPAPPNATASDTASGEWDAALWDESLWDTATQFYTAATQWIEIGQGGISHAPQIQVSNGDTAPPTAKLVILYGKVEYGDDTG